MLDTLSVYENRGGTMHLAGHSVRDLVQRFGSPLVVVLEDVVRANCRANAAPLEGVPDQRIYYAGKAFLTVGFCKLIQSEGLHLDVVSGGELDTALAAQFPPERILMHGNAKTQLELERALDAGVGRIVIDNHADIDRLAALTAGDRRAQVLLRITPGVKPSTHAYVQTGQEDSKFGFNLSDDEARRAADAVLAAEGLDLVGLHCHIGSQIFTADPFGAAATLLIGFYVELQQKRGAPLRELNLGGGLAISYRPGQEPPDVAAIRREVATVVRRRCEEAGVAMPELCFEPGRAIVGPAGITLYTVQSIKRIPGVRNYAGVDGGITDNPRFALYGSYHHVVAPEKLDAATEETWTIAGRCCESGDLLQKDVSLPALATDDLLAFLGTGAYTYSMASHYNRVPKPAVVLVGEGRAELLCARETNEDLLRLDRVPSWLS